MESLTFFCVALLEVRPAVSHCDRELSKMMAMKCLLKCEAPVITVLSLKAKAVTAKARRKNESSRTLEQCCQAAGIEAKLHQSPLFLEVIGIKD